MAVMSAAIRGVHALGRVVPVLAHDGLNLVVAEGFRIASQRSDQAALDDLVGRCRRCCTATRLGVGLDRRLSGFPLSAR